MEKAPVLAALALVVAGTVGVTAHAALRPGCSLLPVALPPPADYAVPSDPAQVCAALGRPMPEPHFLPLGLHRSGIGLHVADLPVPVVRVSVNVSYAMNSRNVMLLGAMPGAFPAGNQPNTTVDGHPAQVNERAIHDGTTDVAYLWSRDGLLLTLHVNLVGGLTRELADRMAASVQ